MMQQMEARRQQMMGELDGILERLGTATEGLDSLVGTMNTARGEAKTDATAAVVTGLVAQRKELLDLVQRQLEMMQQMHMMHVMMQQMEGRSASENEQP